MKGLEKLNKLATGQSDWLERSQWRYDNSHWLKYSQKIALKVLRALREKKMTQKQLAQTLNVSPQYINKIVKGKENLTLETISKLEQALGISLIDVQLPEVKKVYTVSPVVTSYNIQNISTVKKFNITQRYSVLPVKDKFVSYAQA